MPISHAQHWTTAPDRYCERRVPCDLCPRQELRGSKLANHRFIPGSGPEKARVLIIGEAPNKQANSQGTVFGGNGKRELEETYLRMAGLKPEEVRFTNVVKCAARGFNTPTAKTIDICAAHFLGPEILYCDPEIIVTMGASALRPFQGKVVTSLGRASGQQNNGTIDLDMDHGFPLTIDWKGSHRTLIPMYGAAAGMVAADLLGDLMEDFTRLRAILRGEWTHLDDGLEIKPKYTRLRTAEEVRNAVDRVRVSLLRRVLIAIDTESLPDGSAYCLTFALSADQGYLIMREDAEAIESFRQVLADPQVTVICHYLLHDADTCRDMGLDLPLSTVNRIRDTMMDAYHLQLSSQGLKTLSWRLLGIRMREFLDVVHRPSLNMFRVYLEAVAEHPHSWEGKSRKPRQISIAKRAARILKTLDDEEYGLRKPNADGKPYDPWAGWNAIDPEQRALVEQQIGPAPLRSIEWVPDRELLEYACQDAISTYRLLPVLEARARARRQQHSWT